MAHSEIDLPLVDLDDAHGSEELRCSLIHNGMAW